MPEILAVLLGAKKYSLCPGVCYIFFQHYSEQTVCNCLSSSLGCFELDLPSPILICAFGLTAASGKTQKEEHCGMAESTELLHNLTQQHDTIFPLLQEGSASTVHRSIHIDQELRKKGALKVKDTCLNSK